jgi:hypothetical protein
LILTNLFSIYNTYLLLIHSIQKQANDVIVIMMYLPYDTKDKNTTAGIPCAISTSTEFFGDKQQRGFSSSGGGGGGEILCDKSEQSLPLQNDVYAFIAVAPVMSTPFIFALYVVFVKYCVCGLLAFGISFENIGSSNPYDDIVKFLLIPVAIAMQEDLVHVSLSKLFICCVSKTLNVVGGWWLLLLFLLLLLL